MLLNVKAGLGMRDLKAWYILESIAKNHNLGVNNLVSFLLFPSFSHFPLFGFMKYFEFLAFNVVDHLDSHLRSSKVHACLDVAFGILVIYASVPSGIFSFTVGSYTVLDIAIGIGSQY